MQADDHVEPNTDEPLVGVFVVTPIKLYRDGIAHFLRASGRFDVLETADESVTMIRRASELRPDVILLDMAMPCSRDTARALRRLLPGIRIVALAVPESEGEVVDCVEAGIFGYVTRAESLQELLEALQRAANGEAKVSGVVTAEMIRRLAERASDVASPLTVREAEVMGLIDDGLSNKQIAHRLCIEVPTVKNHVHSILDKLGARSRSEAAARARQLQLH